MNITLVQISSKDHVRSNAACGEDFVDTVVLDVGGRKYTATVHTTVRPAANIPGNLVRGDADLQELLRFDAEARAKLYALVGARRRGEPLDLPVELRNAKPQRWAV